MLDILPSMPSTLMPSHDNGCYPRLPRMKDVGCGFEEYRRSPKETYKALAGRAPLQPQSQHVKGVNNYDDHTPNIMNSYSAHAPQAASWSAQPADGLASRAQPYSASQPENIGHSRNNSRPEPFYTKYYSAKKPQSPVMKKEVEQTDSAENQRRPSANESSIASHLQIPSSINDSRGSLPEFAAQITCLFWFESSHTLLAVEEGRMISPRSIGPLTKDAMPSTGFRKWVTTILSMTQVSRNVILLALMFIYRLKKHNPSVKGKVGSEFRLLTVALMLGNKFLDDNTYTNKTWADVSGISVQEIHVMEVEFLSNMRYSLYASKKEWEEWHAQLRKFSDFYDNASHIAEEMAAQAVILPAPRLSIAPNLPSSPVSQQPSPPYMPQISPTNGGIPHPLSIPPLVPSTAASSPAIHTPVSDVGPWPRKRSLDDFSSDHPAKRHMSNVSSAASSSNLGPSNAAVSVASGGTLTPTSRDFSPWRLPPPQYPMARGVGPYSSPILPSHQSPAGRAMASVFPNQSKAFQRAQLPAIHPSHTPSHGPGYPDHQLGSAAPYSQASQTPSPTGYQFSHHHTPTNLSPTGYMANRNSPYRPIRGVNTLLVPPPSTSVQQAPQQMHYDQMHYRPLGGPRNEQRPGQLPLHPFFTWSDNAHQMPPQLPPPSLFPS